MKLRHYQTEAISAVHSEFKTVDATLLVSATGTGKTVMFCEIAANVHHQTRKPVLILAHRTELLEQAKNKLESFGFAPQIEKAEERAFGKLGNAVVASVQSLSRESRLKEYPKDYFGLIITDESHHSPAKSYRAVYDYFTNYKHLGVTATPNRHDEIGLKNIFQSCAYQYSIKDGIKDGFLCKISAMQVQVEDLRLEDVKIVAGEFSNTQLNSMLMQEKVLQSMCLPTIEYAEDRPTIIFTESVEHAHEIVKCFKRITGKDVAVAVDGKMDAVTRAQNLKLFESGQRQFISNVGVLTEGYDHPPTACIALFRPMRSVGLLAQMIGRGTRIADGKADCRVLDFVGVNNTVRTANIYDVLDGTILNDAEKKKAQEFECEGDDALTALEKAKQFIANLESVQAKMRALTSAKDFDILQMFAVPSAKGLYGGDLATEKQVNFLLKLGVKVSPKLQKGEAVKLLDVLVKRMDKKLASIKQMKYLKSLGYQDNFIEDLSFSRASELIGELKA